MGGTSKIEVDGLCRNLMYYFVFNLMFHQLLNALRLIYYYYFYLFQTFGYIIGKLFFFHSKLSFWLYLIP